MRILAVSDTESEYIWDHFDESRFEGVDLMISCGDLKSQYLSFLITMIKAPLFYVHGNHDTNYVDNAPEGCDCIEDKIVEYKGIRIIGLGGSMKYNSHPYNSVPPWQYTEKQMAKRVRKLERKIKAYKGFDIMVTMHRPMVSQMMRISVTQALSVLYPYWTNISPGSDPWPHAQKIRQGSAINKL